MRVYTCAVRILLSKKSVKNLQHISDVLNRFFAAFLSLDPYYYIQSTPLLYPPPPDTTNTGGSALNYIPVPLLIH